MPILLKSLSFRLRVLVCLTALLWAVGIVAGTRSMVQFETTPGDVGSASDRWPSDSQCCLSSTRPTLVMFVHPRCGCSRASLTELSLLMNHCQGLVETQLVFLQPASLPQDWSQTDLWDDAIRIPGVARRKDMDGVEHRRFNARVSGEVFLYQPGGELSFHGGITASRGHTGDNQGRLAIESLLLKQAVRSHSTPVYGCELDPQQTMAGSCNINDEKAVIDDLSQATAPLSRVIKGGSL